MPNIVYVLTNPAMPGIVKIGMTNGRDVQNRMGDLYTTGVPLPFDCVIAREIEGQEAVDIERALHTAFGPNRINASREFFEIDAEQVEVLLRVMPGRDVTPQDSDLSAKVKQEDRDASQDYKKRKSQTDEFRFLQSLNENGTTVYERVLAFGKQEGMKIKWGSKGFSLNASSNGAMIVVCYGYPPSVYNQNIYTDFDSIRRKLNLQDDAIEDLIIKARDTRLFVPASSGINYVCRTDRSWGENDLATLIDWMSTVVERIRQYETETSNP